MYRGSLLQILYLSFVQHSKDLQPFHHFDFTSCRGFKQINNNFERLEEVQLRARMVLVILGSVRLEKAPLLLFGWLGFHLVGFVQESIYLWVGDLQRSEIC
jgi:hypothetical protein